VPRFFHDPAVSQIGLPHAIAFHRKFSFQQSCRLPDAPPCPQTPCPVVKGAKEMPRVRRGLGSSGFSAGSLLGHEVLQPAIIQERPVGPTNQMDANPVRSDNDLFV
jgi:hypothetical protein